MRKLIYLFAFLLLLAAANAQNVTIPDANFKAKLIALGVDTNADGEIQVAEATVVTKLMVDSSVIADLTGISAFINLDTLDCGGNQFVNLDVSALVNLKYLDCSRNYPYLNNLILLPSTNLLHLNYSYTQVSLNFNNYSNLIYLDCSSTSNSNYDFTGLSNLEELYCRATNLNTLDLSNNLNLKVLHWWENYNIPNYFTSINLTAHINLEEIVFNGIDTVNVTNLTNLKTIKADYLWHCIGYNTCTNLTQLTIQGMTITSLTGLSNLKIFENVQSAAVSLDLSPCPNMEYLNLFEATSLSSLQNLGSCLNLEYLDVSGCSSLLSLDVNSCVNLNYLYCYMSGIQSLDLSVCPNLIYVYLPDTMYYLNVKNGNDNENIQCASYYSIDYICADPGQITALVTSAFSYNIDPYCTIIPPTSYNTIEGESRYDANFNGCNTTDSTYNSLLIKVTDGNFTNYAYTNNIGKYEVYTTAGTYTIEPQFQNPAYFTTSPASVYFSNNNNNIQTQDFCITPNGTFPDVEVTLMPFGNAMPGFNATYQIILHNKGTNIASGTISLDFMGNKMNFLSSNTTPTTQNTSQITWNYSNLLPLQTQTIVFVMHILPPSTNNINEILHFTLTANLLNDSDVSDNIFHLAETLIGAYDPNDKTCLEGHELPNTDIGKYLHYLIRFQNTGTAPAQNVVVEDFIDINKYDLTSIQILATSHTADITINNHLLQFYFHNIMLPDSFSNEPESHGYILFKIKTKTNLPYSSTIENDADIYFDYNEPIITNLEATDFRGFVDMTANTENISCNGMGDGSTEIVAIGGLQPFTYHLNGNTQSSPVFSNLAAGNYTAIAIDSVGYSDTLNITISEPTPFVASAVAANPLACLNGTTLVSIIATGGTPPYIGIGNIYLGQTSTPHTVSVIDVNGCSDTASIMLVAQNTTPTAAFTISGGTLGQYTFNNSVSANTTQYFWDFGNGDTSYSANPVYTYPTNGSYTVMFVASNECGSDTIYQNVLVTGLSLLANQLVAEVQIFPIPAKENLNIMAIFEENISGKMVLYDLLGKKVIEIPFEKQKSLEKQISISHLSSGNYLLSIETDKGIYQTKIEK